MTNSKPESIDELRRQLLAASGAGAGTMGLRHLLGSLSLSLFAIESAAAQAETPSLAVNFPETLRIFNTPERQQLAGFVYCQMIERIYSFWKLNEVCIQTIICSGMHKKDIKDSVDRFCDSNKYNENLIKEIQVFLAGEYAKHSEYGDLNVSSTLEDDINKFVDEIINKIDSYVYPDLNACGIT